MNNGKETYFELMTYLTEKVYGFMKIILSTEADKNAPGMTEHYLEFFMEYQNYRAGTVWLRPTIAQLFFCGAMNPNGTVESAFSEEILPILTAIEMLNTSTYLTNLMLDEKRGYTSAHRMKQAVIAAFKFRELAQKLIHEYAPSNSVEYLVKRMSEVNDLIYEGQYVDVFALAENFTEMSDVQQEQMLEHRSNGFSGGFYSFVPEVGALLAGADEERLAHIREFGRLYGIALQLSNDLGDCVTPKNTSGFQEKPYKDVLSDVRNGRLTWPLKLAYDHPDFDSSFVLAVQSWNEGTLAQEVIRTSQAFQEHLKELGVFEITKKKLRQMIRQMEKELNAGLEKSVFRDLLKGQVYTSLLRNKYLKQANA